MVRERQRVRDIQGYIGDGIIQFSPEGEIISELDYYVTKETVVESGRREGQVHIGEQTVRRLGVSAVYESIDQLAAGALRERRSPRLDYYNTSWTIDEMPDEVQSEYQDWCDSLLLDEDDFRQTLHDRALQPVNRMTEKVDCPYCPSDPKYACYLSGWSKELYKYPMVRMATDDASAVYEAPFDAALLVEHHPDALTYGIRPQFDHAGSMSARFVVELNVDKVSNQYVQAVTNGAVVPKEETLTLLSDGNFRMYVADWYENGARVDLYECNNVELADKLQAMVTVDNAERVTDIDYNEMLDRVRRRLGGSGLSLAFRNTSSDWGDRSIHFMAIDDKVTIVAQQLPIGEDAYEALERMDKKVQANVPLPSYF